MTVPQIAGLTTIISSGQPCAAELLADRREVADAAAPAAVLLGDVDAEVAVLADLQPQLGGLLAGAGLLGEVVAAVLRWPASRTAARSSWRSSVSVNALLMLLLAAFVTTTARTSPARPATPGSTSISVTVPSCGARHGVLHLHRLQHEHGLAGGDLGARPPPRRRRPCRASARAASRSRPRRPGRRSAATSRSRTWPRRRSRRTTVRAPATARSRRSRRTARGRRRPRAGRRVGDAVGRSTPSTSRTPSRPPTRRPRARGRRPREAR